MPQIELKPPFMGSQWARTDIASRVWRQGFGVKGLASRVWRQGFGVKGWRWPEQVGTAQSRRNRTRNSRLGEALAALHSPCSHRRTGKHPSALFRSHGVHTLDRSISIPRSTLDPFPASPCGYASPYSLDHPEWPRAAPSRSIALRIAGVNAVLTPPSHSSCL